MRFWDFRRSEAYSGPRGYHLTAYTRPSKIRTTSEDMNICSHNHKNICSNLRKCYPANSILEYQFDLAHLWPQTSTLQEKAVKRSILPSEGRYPFAGIEVGPWNSKPLKTLT